MAVRHPESPLDRRYTGPSALLVLALLAGCTHLIEPGQPPWLPVEGDLSTLAATTGIRIENAYAGPVLRCIRSEGIHSMEVDLRDWTARVVSGLAVELDRRHVSVSVPPASLSGTSSVTGSVPRARPSSAEPARVLRVRVTEVRAPCPDGCDPLVTVQIRSAAGDFSARYASSPEAVTFRDALYDLKRTILEDPRFRHWLAASPPASGPENSG